MSTTAQGDSAMASEGVTAPPTAAPSTAAPSTASPRPRGRGGRVLGWILVIALVVVLALLSLRLMPTELDLGGALNPESPGPNGAGAIAELTRQQGVQIDVTRSHTSATAQLDPGATLVLTDPPALSDSAVMDLVHSADRVVLLSSSSRMLRLLDLGESTFAAGSVQAECDLPEFSRVGTVDAERMFVPGAGVTACFIDDEGHAAVLRGVDGDTTITLLDATKLLSNQHLAENGNAALGLALLAQTDDVVWYVPSFADSDLEDGEPASLGELTPNWVTPVILLLLLAGLAAIWWRGRRFGPLVTESLPVTVRASETMHGRARLTAKAADAAHAAAAIRTGTRTRLASRLALSPRASSQEVADAVSDRLRVPRGSLYELLDGATPQSDHDLIDLARSLAELETAVDAAVHTERNRP
ncbi:DUF4350 domain-containing protein [Microbacterium sp. H1-D42]|uniref:DUF4350 domain-containing protein n=1 Tax=Microbacterium sp. H1-D42 TaxID=2925844 RepID=UPI001F539568|nr:DUF4350 domain-containing protein [Microbacterium sp. H1-D42]UNK69693.1 DUF4350 domain-containing protein [Microbacterium sp. H1-D42]